MGFSRQEYWSELPCPPPEELSDSGIKLASLCLLHRQVGSLLRLEGGEEGLGPWKPGMSLPLLLLHTLVVL